MNEVWGWAERLSADMQRHEDIRSIRQAIYEADKQCGSCYNWMKSSMCPRERNIKGMNHGPSCKSAICEKFVINERDARRIVELKGRLAELTAPERGSAP